MSCPLSSPHRADGTAPVEFVAPVGEARYRWLAATLRLFHYSSLKRADKGLLQAYLRKMGSEAQQRQGRRGQVQAAAPTRWVLAYDFPRFL